MRALLRTARAVWLGTLADGERRAGRYERADRLARESLALLGETAPAGLRIRLLNTLGMTCKYRRRFREGAGAYLAALRLARRHLGPDHPARAALWHNVGGLEHERGRFARAEPFARRSVEVRRRALGAGHPDVARDVAALAAILDGLGRHAEAEALHRAALRTFETAGRRQRLEVGFTLANLAACCHRQGRSGEAAQLAASALPIQVRLLGPRHPEVILTRENLEAIRRAAGCGAP